MQVDIEMYTAKEVFSCTPVEYCKRISVVGDRGGGMHSFPVNFGHKKMAAKDNNINKGNWAVVLDGKLCPLYLRTLSQTPLQLLELMQGSPNQQPWKWLHNLGQKLVVLAFLRAGMFAPLDPKLC